MNNGIDPIMMTDAYQYSMVKSMDTSLLNMRVTLYNYDN